MATLRHTYPAGVPCWADIDVPDPADAERFYGGLFGWEFEQRADGYRISDSARGSTMTAPTPSARSVVQR